MLVGQYYITWEVFEQKKWRVMKTDILNDIPMTEKWNKIGPGKIETKYFIIDNIFTGTFKKYKQMIGRLALTYSYSEKLTSRRVSYSDKFITSIRKGN